MTKNSFTRRLHSDEVVLVNNDSDSDILVMVGNADFVDFSDDDCSTLEEFKGEELNT